MTLKNCLSLVIAGEAGQGIQTIEKLLAEIFKFSGFNVFATKEYMSRVRGGINSTELRVCSERVQAYVDKIDLLVPLNRGAITRLRPRIDGETLIIGEKEALSSEQRPGDRIIEVKLTEIAQKLGSPIFSNVVASGLIAAIAGADKETALWRVKLFFSKKGDEIIGKNLEALMLGFQLGRDIQAKYKTNFELTGSETVKNEILMNGGEAVALGAIAGGCNFLAAYPMTPSTVILDFMARHSKEFGVITEQAEDEISAMNMALGAWYAGARALASTSGGGFDLMQEGLSLAGMIESPIVINLGQRPGPATGLPTRTEQADLQLALHAGHGEFPRIIFAPGKLEDAAPLTTRAFDLADKYQVPVFVLTDQYLVDSYYNLPASGLSALKPVKNIVETTPGYQRYRLTPDGVSPRGIPGFGRGLVCVDSDEHDEQGHITEDLELRTKMVDKRLKKLEGITAEVIEPELIGDPKAETLVIGWGTTYCAIAEALKRMNDKNTAFLHYKQVYPLHPKTSEYLSKAKTRIVVENNATAQFARLIMSYTGIDIEHKILKYNGLPFSVEELEVKIRRLLTMDNGQ
jgi:2-oxoglutarate/2-oxoacid ferredoxin oxidoreductase subunit alpha